MSGVIDTIRRATHTRRAHRNQSGFTLLEAIVSMALIATVILALATGLLTSVKSSASAKGTQLADGALSAYAENFKGRYPTSPANPCPSPSEFMATAGTPAWFAEPDSGIASPPPVVTQTEGWDETTESWELCTSRPALDSGLARLTVSVRVDTGDGDIRESTGQVVVRKEP
jgi:prepilin-type N-terminal cleavage/methylation domain-containing protein